ncbi:MAG: glycosyltransferase [Richelia sp. RM2_1_2]|nr:glycosyltransferase [Richelia sp. SM1_7_0]NJN10922.1 glycosyltransferase [Richelia sp. RM1_1_1]NJO30033.1 glycosyltransferase [Richelia sp. SL_2_1]NJO61419.1 glycosyltransferase [Richelia sp. RM2_1_2]
MAIAFYISLGRDSLPISSTTYVIEKFNGQISTSTLNRAVEQFNECNENNLLPEAFIWDDLIFKTSKKARLIPFRVQWCALDSLLYPHVNHTGRCAIRADILHKLLQEKIISRADDTSAALAFLSKKPEVKIVELDNLLRFVGWEENKVYKPLSYPAPSQKAKSISVIINYRDRPELMSTCLKSISQQQVNVPLEIILVDNQSKPENRQAVESQLKQLLPANITTQHLHYDAPFNHSAQSNLGAKNANGEVLMMFNNDAQLIDKHTLQILADWAITPGVASVGPRIIGKNQRLVSSGVQVCLPIGNRAVRLQESTVSPLSQTVHYCAGNGFACAAISREIWFKLGGLNPIEFPTQYNDAEYFLRAMDAGFNHIYVGSLEVYHEPGQSEVRTREIVEKIHDKLRDLYPYMGKYHRLNPALLKETSNLLQTAINVPNLLKIFLAYRRFYKKLGLK